MRLKWIQPNQKIEAGDDSVNRQAGRDINSGNTYNITIDSSKDEVSKSLLSLLEKKIPVFSQEAKHTYTNRTKTLVYNLFYNLGDDLSYLESFKDPDVQNSLFEAQKAYSSTGDEKLGKCLVSMLLDRVKEKNQSNQAIIINEAISKLSNLNSFHLNAISLVYFITEKKYPDFSSIVAVNRYLKKYALPLSKDLPKESTFYDHLLYKGFCRDGREQTKLNHGNHIKGVGSFVYTVASNFPFLFCGGCEERYARRFFPLGSGNPPDLVKRHFELKGNTKRKSGYPKYYPKIKTLEELEDFAYTESWPEGLKESVLNWVYSLDNRMHVDIATETLLFVGGEIREVIDLWDHTKLRELLLYPVGRYIAKSNLEQLEESCETD